MPEITNYQIAEAMKAIGGSFVQALAKAWYAADARNRERIQTHFDDIWEEYRDLVFIKASRDIRT